MNIEYGFSESEKKIVREYLKKKHIKKTLSENRHIKKTKSVFYFEISIAMFFTFVLLAITYFNFISYNFSDIITFTLSALVILVIFIIITPLVFLRAYAINIVVQRRIYRRKMRVSMFLHLYSYMLKVDRMLSNFEPVVRLNIENDTGKLIFSTGMVQEFNCQTISYDDVYREIKFYSFTDSKTHKRYVLPIPVKYSIS